MGVLDIVAYGRQIAADDSIGYDQVAARNGGVGIDCSELVRRAIAHAGYVAPPYLWTGNMHAELEKLGWLWIPGTEGLQAGDILWRSGHTAIYNGDGSRSEAWSDERGQITGGKPGDQTGQEVRVHRPWNSITWEGHFRPGPNVKTTTTQKEGFLMALTDAEQKTLAARIQNIQDILTGYAPNKYVQKGCSLPLIGSRVRDVKDYITGGGPRGEDATLLRQILETQEAILSRLDRLTKLEGTHE